MRESIHKYFQVGTIRWMSFPNRSVVDQVKRIAVDDYFDAIEVTKCADDAEREEVKKILEQSHLKVCYGAQPRLLGPKLNPNDVDEDGRKKAKATLIEAVDEAEYLGAKGVAFLAGKWEDETKDQAYVHLLKTTRNVCDYSRISKQCHATKSKARKTAGRSSMWLLPEILMTRLMWTTTSSAKKCAG